MGKKKESDTTEASEHSIAHVCIYYICVYLNKILGWKNSQISLRFLISEDSNV